MDRILHFERLVRLLLKLSLISDKARPQVYTGNLVVDLITLKASWV